MARITTLKPRIPTMHQVQHGWAGERRGSAAERGYGAEWQRLRRSILARDCGLCQPCKRRHRISIGRTVDHQVPKARGGTDSPINLQTICDACHAAKTAAESRGLVWDEREAIAHSGAI